MGFEEAQGGAGVRTRRRERVLHVVSTACQEVQRHDMTHCLHVISSRSVSPEHKVGGYVSRYEAGETSEWGQVMKNLLHHGQELGLDPGEHDEMPPTGHT